MARIESTVAYLNAPRQLEFRSESLDSGNVAAGQVLCETLVTAISPGTELAAYVGLPALREGTGYPRLQGYCNVARVLAAGAGVSHIEPGQRVLSFASHRSHFSMPADDVLQVLADGARSEDMACAYLFHLGYNAVLRSAVRPGSRVLVIGLGALGLTSVAMAAIAGARVVGVSDHALPQRLGLEFGASAVLSRSDDGAIRLAMSADLADVVITTSMDWGDWQLALQLAGHRATIACLGFPGRNRPPGDFNPLDSRYFYAKQLRIEAVGMSPERREPRGFLRFNERDNLDYVTALILAGRLKPASLVSGTYAGNDLARAYEALLARERPAVTCLLRWAPG
jgi:threonine dehydrogenase-like Zn-dependent dehydrogenase